MDPLHIQNVIGKLFSFCYYIGLWHRGDTPTGRELCIKLFHSIYYALFFISLLAGTIVNENPDVFLAEGTIIAGVMAVKMWLLMWNQTVILVLLERICAIPFRDNDDHVYINKKTKLKGFSILVITIISVTITAAILSAVAPFLRTQRILFVQIGFPLDWRNSEIAFWIASTFILTGQLFYASSLIYTATIWYLLIQCGLRCEVLGKQLRELGQIDGNKKILKEEKSRVFLQDLKSSIDDYVCLRKTIAELHSFCANVFFLQIVTSALCICGSVYCLAFNIGNSLTEQAIHTLSLIYNLSDIFMIMYCGNEIKLSSSRLVQNLFESNWIDQSESTKKCIIIFAECLQQPHLLLAGKIYPLTLETFTRILISAYNSFNILKNLAD